MFNLFNRFAYLYGNEENPKVDSTKDYYKVFKQIKQELMFHVGSRYLVGASVGATNRTFTPWFALYNTKITRSARHGLYVVFLMKKDMSGFYLTLNQGITYFEERYKPNQYLFAKKVSLYFQEQIESSNFDKADIDLAVDKSDIGYGYQFTNIISKFYPFDHKNQTDIYEDLNEILSIYDLLVERMNGNEYSDIIDIIIDNQDNNDFSNSYIDKEIIEELKKDQKDENLDIIDLKMVEVPHSTRKTTSIERTKLSKIKYLEKAEKDMKLGYLGELAVFEFEKQRLTDLGLETRIDEIKWVAKEFDGYGYDLISLDIINDKIVTIYIEVKTTISNENTDFFISHNEVLASDEYGERYFIYRIHNIQNNHADIYRINGTIRDKFDLKPITFRAKLK